MDEQHLTDSRRGKNTQFPLADLLRPSVYSAWLVRRPERRPEALPGPDLPAEQQRLVKSGGRLIKHARYYWLLLVESHLTRRPFGAMLQRIAALPSPAG